MVATLRKWPQNATAAQEMILGHLDLVTGLARQYTNGGGEQQFIDLLGEGRLALCEAVAGFVHEKPRCRFSTYVHRAAKRAMISWLRQDGTIKGSEWQARLAKKARASQNRIAQRLGRFPTREEMSYSCGPQEASALFDQPAVEYVDPADLEHEAGRPIKPGVKTGGLVGALPLANQADGWGAAAADRFAELPSHTRIVIESLLSLGVTVGELAGRWGESRDEMVVELEHAHHHLATARESPPEVSTPRSLVSANPNPARSPHANRYVQRR